MRRAVPGRRRWPTWSGRSTPSRAATWRTRRCTGTSSAAGTATSPTRSESPPPRPARPPPRRRAPAMPSVGLSVCLSLFQELQQQKRPEEPQVQGGREALQQVFGHLGSGECRAEPRGTEQTSLAPAPSLSLASSLSLSPSQSLVSSLSLTPSLSPSPARGAPQCSWSHGGPLGCRRTSFPFKLLYLPCLS